jgi:hypothetical protein
VLAVLIVFVNLLVVGTIMSSIGQGYFFRSASLILLSVFFAALFLALFVVTLSGLIIVSTTTDKLLEEINELNPIDLGFKHPEVYCSPPLSLYLSFFPSFFALPSLKLLSLCQVDMLYLRSFLSLSKQQGVGWKIYSLRLDSLFLRAYLSIFTSLFVLLLSRSIV